MTVNTILQGNARDCLKDIPPNIIQTIITSPPYFGLRDYGTATWEGGNDPACDHMVREARPRTERPNHDGSHMGQGGATHEAQDRVSLVARDICPKCGARRIDSQIGLETTVDAYVQNLVEVFREARRVLHPTGTLWLNLGDSYAGSSTGGFRPGAGRVIDDRNQRNRDGVQRQEDLKPKDLLGVPWRVAFALQSDGWYLRSFIPWLKYNAMPEPGLDRPIADVESFFLLTKEPRYFYDRYAVRKADPIRFRRESDWFFESCWQGILQFDDDNPLALIANTQPFKGKHFATYPLGLIEPIVKAATPAKGVCPTCRSPWTPVVERLFTGAHDGKEGLRQRERSVVTGGTTTGVTLHRTEHLQHTVTGWQPSCECGEQPVPAIILDPFMGSGTTAIAAKRNRRHYLGIELNPNNIIMAEERIAEETSTKKMLTRIKGKK